MQAVSRATPERQPRRRRRRPAVAEAGQWTGSRWACSLLCGFSGAGALAACLQSFHEAVQFGIEALRRLKKAGMTHAAVNRQARMGNQLMGDLRDLRRYHRVDVALDDQGRDPD